METIHYYDVAVKHLSDRKGELSSTVLDSTLEVVTPPEFPGGIPNRWSPEHLLVAAVNSCLMTTFLAIAENSKLDFAGFHSNAIGKLEKVEGKFMISEVELKPVVLIRSEEQRERAQRVLEKSEANCLISNSVKSKIIFTPQIQLA